MDIRQFNYALMVAEELNFSKAAKRLHIAQPSLSQAIGALEQQIGVQLFDRSVTPLKLTHAGEIFMSRARHICNMHASLLHEMETLAGNNSNVLSIGVSKGRCASLFATILPIFHAKHPEVELNIHETYTAELEAWLRKGITDLNIMHAASITNYPGLVQKSLHREEIVVLLPLDHPLKSKVRHIADRPYPAISLSELRDEKFIFPKSGLKFRNFLNKLFSEAGYMPNIILEFPDRETTNKMTVAGMGISFALWSAGKPSRFSEKVICCTLDNPIPFLSFDVVAMYRAQEQLSRTAAEFIKVAKFVLSN